MSVTPPTEGVKDLQFFSLGIGSQQKELVAGTMDTEPTMVALMRLLKDLCADHEGDAEFHECF
jgi:hypothetical protein